MGLSMIAYDVLLEQGREALLELEELPVFLIDDDSIANWWAAAEMPDEELTKRKADSARLDCKRDEEQ
jgi:hypothetical protein